ncbi:MAG: aldo/keto reductase [Bacteroidales bacterium]|nr:MAG: aldo/keto reductase [Bacteroidales bacterium]
MEKLTEKRQLGKTEINVPPVIFGTSCLGNLYQALSDELKLEIIRQWFECVEKPVVIDTAGKYGAGLALEVIGDGLRELGILPEQIIISNKLGWSRTELKTPEPLFEPGVWKDLKHDAIQKINYKGILECWEQGCELLGGSYKTSIVSVHDPDEYLAQAVDNKDRNKRFADIIGAYNALYELKEKGEVAAIGVGSKDWHVIKELTDHIRLDWVMLAVSLTIMNHSEELLKAVETLNSTNTGIINSAVFHAGFLTGGEFFDYRKPDPLSDEDKGLFEWREKFFRVCSSFNVKPAEACVRFAMTPPGIISIALNTSKPERVRQNVDLVHKNIPEEFWSTMKEENLINRNYPFAG